jgi:hypothetical protein
LLPEFRIVSQDEMDSGIEPIHEFDSGGTVADNRIESCYLELSGGDKNGFGRGRRSPGAQDHVRDEA